MSDEFWDLQGKTVLITGASSGIGSEAARKLGKLGARVIVVGRSYQRATMNSAHIVASGGKASAYAVDYAQLANVARLAEELESVGRIDVVCHNAGALITKRRDTIDGFDLSLQINYLSHFLLQRLLEDKLRAQETPVRVIATSSVANLLGTVHLSDLNRRSRLWQGFAQYSSSKLMLMMFMKSLAERYQGENISTYSFHPGLVRSNFGRGALFPSLLFRIPGPQELLLSPAAGAEPLVWLAGAREMPFDSGTYFDRFKPNGSVSPKANDAALMHQLWDASEDLLRDFL